MKSEKSLLEWKTMPDPHNPASVLLTQGLGQLYLLMKDPESHKECQYAAIEEFSDAVDRMVHLVSHNEATNFANISRTLKFVWMAMHCYRMEFEEAQNYLDSGQTAFN